MPLATGLRLGPYEILRPIGSGGMGEVYQARDTRLDRTVAVKVLSAAKADNERRARFLQEARSASALNHPNIVVVHDVGSQDEIDWLAMEYVAGRTLHELIPTSGMEIRAALGIAEQVAAGLAAAHAAHIIHRDLKPSNIIVTEDGTAKILDFGLARITGPATDDQTRTLVVETEPGVVLGTLNYMSPEQAEGARVDSRTDIFSFGAVLYEMVSGRRAFAGSSRISVLSAIAREDPPPLDNVPHELERVIQRCLRKGPARRWQSIADVRIALQDLREESLTALPRRSGEHVQPGWHRKTALICAGLLLPLAATALWIYRSSSGTVDELRPALVRITSDPGLSIYPALSADGKLVAYASDRGGDGNLDIWVQQSSGSEPVRLTSDPAHDTEPAFSPDGSRVAFRSDRRGGGIYVVSAFGGEARLYARFGHRPKYSPDGKWIAYRRGESGGTGGTRYVDIIPADGGSPQQLNIGKLTGITQAIWSPDNRRLLVLASVLSQPPAWYLLSTDGRDPVRVQFADGSDQPGGRTAIPIDWIGDQVYFRLELGDAFELFRARFPAGSTRIASQPRRITVGAAGIASASITVPAPEREIIAYAAVSADWNVWSVELPVRDTGAASDTRAVTASPLLETSGSAAGHMLAFSRAGGSC